MNRLILAAAAGVGSAVVIAVTQPGIGLSSDSATYVAAAENLASGAGFTIPTQSGDDVAVTLFPPLFPAVLSLFERAGVDAATGARWLHVVLVGINVALIVGLVHRYAGGSTPAIAMAALVPVASADFLRVHAMAWSEPLFIFFVVLGIAGLVRFLDRRSDLLLLGSSFAFTLAWFTRYAGAAVLVGAVVVIMLSGKDARRYRDAFVFASAATIPVALWLSRNLATTESMVVAAGKGTSRALALHPVTSYTLKQGLAAAARWIAPLDGPSPVTYAVGALVATILVGVLVIGVKLAPGERVFGHLPRVVAILSIAYVVGLLLSISFIDASTPIDERVLAPLHVLVIIVVACLVANIRQRHRGPRTRSWVVLFVLTVASWAALGAGAVLRASRDGLALSETTWRRSETVALVRSLPTDVRIYSDFPEVIYLLTDRSADVLPLQIDPISRRPNPAYAEQIGQLRRQIRTGRAIVVMFPLVQKWYVPSVAELRRGLGIGPTRPTSDGVLFGRPQPR